MSGLEQKRSAAEGEPATLLAFHLSYQRLAAHHVTSFEGALTLLRDVFRRLRVGVNIPHCALHRSSGRFAKGSVECKQLESVLGCCSTEGTAQPSSGSVIVVQLGV